MKLLQQHKGQAATECVITAAFVLVPLFLIVPLLGKYIDIRQNLVSQARFEAWEYTAWFGPDEKKHILSDKPKSHSAWIKAYDTTAGNGNSLFFSNPTDSDYGTDSQTFELNPLWRDHRGQYLFQHGKNSLPKSKIAMGDTPDPTSGSGANLIDDLLQVFSWITTTFGELLEALGTKAKFDAIYTKGYYTAQVGIKAHSLDQILPPFDLEDDDLQKKKKPLRFSAKASVLANDWSAGGREKAIEESKGLVVTSLLHPLSKPFNDAISTLQRGFDDAANYLPIDVRLPHLPDFGYIEEDLIPLEYLTSKTGKEQYKKITASPEHGLYFYEEKDE